jgi:septal ring factor EnvC (AmiA/AmiB activator)
VVTELLLPVHKQVSHLTEQVAKLTKKNKQVKKKLAEEKAVTRHFEKRLAEMEQRLDAKIDSVPDKVVKAIFAFAAANQQPQQQNQVVAVRPMEWPVLSKTDIVDSV